LPGPAIGLNSSDARADELAALVGGRPAEDTVVEALVQGVAQADSPDRAAGAHGLGGSSSLHAAKSLHANCSMRSFMIGLLSGLGTK
jgi:hypothetical protein